MAAHHLPCLDTATVKFITDDQGETAIHRCRTDMHKRGLFVTDLEWEVESPDADATKLQDITYQLADKYGIQPWVVESEFKHALFYVAYRNLNYPSTRLWKNPNMMRLVREFFLLDMREFDISQKEWMNREANRYARCEAERLKSREERDW